MSMSDEPVSGPMTFLFVLIGAAVFITSATTIYHILWHYMVHT